MKSKAYFISFLVIGLFILIAGGGFRQIEQSFVLDSLLNRKQFASSPVLSAEESIKAMQLESGFKVELVTKEPLISSPVAMVFDKSGRIWVAEMEGYMPDTLGTGEEQPVGRIVILADKNGDGVMDDRKVFLDSLILPRAICLIGNGILVAESPRLWFYEIKDDKPVRKTLVDPSYAEGGNVEHQPNGLFRALDNWIYNAKSDRRYRKQGEKWIIERTHFRGQWGITQDDQGRLFYNTNSENLLGDLFSPGFGASNENQLTVAGFNKKIVGNNKVYPARPTTGVNRGYQPGILDDKLKLVNFTAACGPVIYNGHLFSKQYYGNAFVAEPSANLIKRNILTNDGYSINGTQAYSDQEFLRSTDERFRPVNLYNGPDGALYIVDMYRGIIQHKTYLTPYLKNEIRERSLTEPLAYGRIYKVTPSNKKLKAVKFSDDKMKLVRLLGHQNGWVRSMAQQLLVDAGDRTVSTELRKILRRSSKAPLAITHAMWTLEGLGVLDQDDIRPFLTSKEWPLRMQALSISRSVINKENYLEFVKLFDEMILRNDTLAAPYVAFLTSSIKPYNYAIYKRLVTTLGKNFGDELYVADALISNLKNEEAAYYKEFTSLNSDTSVLINKRLKKVVDDAEKAKNNKADIALQYPRGTTIFKSFCQTCHGPDGNGVTSLAPPLNNSEWVTGDKNKLSAIVLHGLTGPIQIGNKLYKAPEINGEMPGIAANDEFSDSDIAQLLNYIRNSWNNKGDRIAPKDVTDIRNRFKGRQKPFTMGELNQMK
jgi:mono/diheme cytochrome c family protein/glucose/arabinose dehydrogenase